MAHDIRKTTGRSGQVRQAAAETFAAGERVVYPSHGVGTVESVGAETIGGTSIDFIRVSFPESRMVVRVPVAKARSAGLRRLASREEFARALSVLKGRPRSSKALWARRALDYEGKINSGDPVLVAEVARDLGRNFEPSGQEASMSERHFYERAVDRLAQELAALEGTDKAAAMGRLGDEMRSRRSGAEVPPGA